MFRCLSEERVQERTRPVREPVRISDRVAGADIRNSVGVGGSHIPGVVEEGRDNIHREEVACNDSPVEQEDNQKEDMWAEARWDRAEEVDNNLVLVCRVLLVEDTADNTEPEEDGEVEAVGDEPACAMCVEVGEHSDPCDLLRKDLFPP